LKDHLQSVADSINDLDTIISDPEAWTFMTLIFIILFVGILSFYAINLDVVSLLADSSFLFLAMLNLYLNMMYSINY
jgi:hypothetical protein